MENTPRSSSPQDLLKLYLVSQTFTGVFFNWLLIQLSTKKNYWLRMFAIANPTEILHYEKVKIRQRTLL